MIGTKFHLVAGVALLAIAGPALALSSSPVAPPAATTTSATPAHPGHAEAATPAPAQAVGTPLTFGQSVEGQISAPSGTCDNSNPRVRVYSFAATAGDRIEATMTADDFDTTLEIGKMEGCTFTSLGTNDDGAGPEDGLNSRITAHIVDSGTYILRATALSDEGAGKFTLALNRLPARTTTATPRDVTIGRRVRGTLTATDATIDNSRDESTILESSRPYHMYQLNGTAGQSFVVTLKSDEFDPFLDVGSQSPLGFSVAASNDDGGGEDDGLNSRLTVTFQTAGTVMIRVSPLGSDTGDYELKVENAPAK
jgi:hypothetical protein